MDKITTAVEDGLLVVRIDDGKANVIGSPELAVLNSALDQAETDRLPILLVGRPGKFSAGFDLAEMAASTEEMRALVKGGAQFLMRLFTSPRPVVCAATGHSLALGALMLLASDYRVGASGPYKVGLNEVAIGMQLPIFGVELAKARMTPGDVERSALHSTVYSPEQAQTIGFLDEVVAEDQVESTARAHAQRLGALRIGAYSITKNTIRGARAAYVAETLDEDIASLQGPKL
ncbi:MAG: crotonase/enoyl-CoA hydratase family protein [Acidimicrobiia bacterium]|jgi:enoyl-CoA hydratase|nr:crotonase/enoyl-CoA hydratase family protein [Acidimicrobiia bacterium]